jgi:hypothetical protein
MNWRKNFEHIIASQNPQNPQKGGLKGGFEDIEDFAYNSHFINNNNNNNNENFISYSLGKYPQNPQNYFLPSSCPLVTRKITPGVMKRCRFNEKILRRLINTEALNSTTGCPLSSACGLWCPWPRKPQPGGSNGTGEARAKCLGCECEHVVYKYEVGIDRADAPMLWCAEVDSAVVDLGKCPLGFWEKNNRGWPRNIKERPSDIHNDFNKLEF